ncbi:MAG: c-type cytochrome [Gemmatimonadota bacterium]
MRSDLRRRAAGMVLLLAVALSTGCTEFEERVLYRIPTFTYMHESPAFDPYEMPLPPPPGAVPFASPAGSKILPPLEASEVALNAFAAGPYGTNPYDQADPALLELGQVMYDRHCAVCHGATGVGDGPIVTKPGEEGRFPALVTNLTLPASVARADGYLYGVIHAGRSMMPAYGPRTTDQERWAIVSYLREVIQAGGAEPAPAAEAQDTAAAPTATTGLEER